MRAAAATNGDSGGADGAPARRAAADARLAWPWDLEEHAGGTAAADGGWEGDGEGGWDTSAETAETVAGGAANSSPLTHTPMPEAAMMDSLKTDALTPTPPGGDAPNAGWRKAFVPTGAGGGEGGVAEMYLCSDEQCEPLSDALRRLIALDEAQVEKLRALPELPSLFTKDERDLYERSLAALDYFGDWADPGQTRDSIVLACESPCVLNGEFTCRHGLFRPERERLHAKILEHMLPDEPRGGAAASAPRRAFIVVGVPGSGKDSVLKRFLRKEMLDDAELVDASADKLKGYLAQWADDQLCQEVRNYCRTKGTSRRSRERSLGLPGAARGRAGGPRHSAAERAAERARAARLAPNIRSIRALGCLGLRLRLTFSFARARSRLPAPWPRARVSRVARRAGSSKHLLHAQYLHRESIYVVQRLVEHTIARGLPFMCANHARGRGRAEARRAAGSRAASRSRALRAPPPRRAPPQAGEDALLAAADRRAGGRAARRRLRGAPLRHAHLAFKKLGIPQQARAVRPVARPAHLARPGGACAAALPRQPRADPARSDARPRPRRRPLVRQLVRRRRRPVEVETNRPADDAARGRAPRLST
jgi:hypothetical protein